MVLAAVVVCITYAGVASGNALVFLGSLVLAGVVVGISMGK